MHAAEPSLPLWVSEASDESNGRSSVFCYACYAHQNPTADSLNVEKDAPYAIGARWATKCLTSLLTTSEKAVFGPCP